MKKLIVFLSAASLLLGMTACSSAGESSRVPLEELPEDYSLKQAKADGCVVHEDGDISSGQDIWDKFLSDTQSGRPASVRIGNYFTLDESSCAPEYYEAEKDNYPVLYISDLSFDGKTYTIRSIEEDGEFERSYKYLMSYEESGRAGAAFQKHLMNVLTNDDTVTWEDIFSGMISSQFGAHIDHHTVYSDYIY